MSSPSDDKPKNSLHIRNVVILACAVDAADKALLPATFKALSKQMDAGPAQLGALTFAQSITFSLSLPVWSSLMQCFSARDLLVAGCCLWGCATLAISFTSTFAAQFVLRLANGAALAAVNPLGQAILCDLVPEAERGHTFGLLQSCGAALAVFVSSVATGIASSRIGLLDGWRFAHIIVAIASFAVALVLRMTMPKSMGSPSKEPSESWCSEQRRVVKAICSKPSFVILVLQGVTGAIPWNGMSFLTLYFQLSGYSDWQAGRLHLIQGLGSIGGGLMGGVLGDRFARSAPCAGRIVVAQASVVLGMVFFAWMLHIPYGPGSLPLLAAVAAAFGFTACWTPAAACRPICGSIFRESRERAQVLALWIATEGVAASVFGAPLAGALSEAFGFRLQKGAAAVADASNAFALRRALLGVSMVPWMLCALAWLPMYWAFPRDRRIEEESTDLTADCKAAYGATASSDVDGFDRISSKKA